MGKLGFAAVAALTASLIQPTAALAADPAPPANAVQQAKLVNEAFSRYSIQSAKCRWGRPIIGAAMFAELGMWKDFAAAEDKEAEKAIKVDLPEAQPCGSAPDLQAQNGALLTFWSWATRAAIMANFNAQPGWTQNLLMLDVKAINDAEPVRAAYENQIATAMGQAQLDAMKQRLIDEARLVINLECESRKNYLSSTPRACPAIPDNLVGQRPGAEIRTIRIESFVRALPVAIEQEQRGEFGMPYQLKNDPLDFSLSCKKDAFVIYPESPDTKEADGVLDVAVRRYGSAELVGRVKVKESQGAYDVVDPAGLGWYGLGWAAQDDILKPNFNFCSTAF